MYRYINYMYLFLACINSVCVASDPTISGHSINTIVSLFAQDPASCQTLAYRNKDNHLCDTTGVHIPSNRLVVPSQTLESLRIETQDQNNHIDLNNIEIARFHPGIKQYLTKYYLLLRTDQHTTVIPPETAYQTVDMLYQIINSKRQSHNIAIHGFRISGSKLQSIHQEKAPIYVDNIHGIQNLYINSPAAKIVRVTNSSIPHIQFSDHAGVVLNDNRNTQIHNGEQHDCRTGSHIIYPAP